jgi:hypothetical protein
MRKKKMKTKIIFFCVLVIFLLPGFLKSQCYTVLSVKGEIILEKTGRPIQEMDEICANDKLSFSTEDSKAAVLSSDQGRFIIKMSKKKKNDNLTAYVKSVIMQGTGNLSSRGEVTLESEFGDVYFVVVKYALPIDIKNYPLSENNFFYIKYLFDGKEINKKLKFNRDTLFIEKENIYKVDDKSIDQGKVENVTLYYYEKEKNTSTKITSFQLIFADESKLTKEINDYITLLRNGGKYNDYILQEVLLYLTDIYGNINIDNVKVWLQDKFGLK